MTAPVGTCATFSFEPPTVPWGKNKKLHWSKTAKLTKFWKQATYFAAREASWVLDPVRDHYLTIEVQLPFDEHRRRDEHNYVSTTCAAIVDGIVQAGVIPDDNPTWLGTVSCKLRVEPGGLVHVVLTVSEP